MYVQVESNPPYEAGLEYGGISDVAQINYRAISTDRGQRKAAHLAPVCSKFLFRENKLTYLICLLISNLSSRKETDWYVVYFPGACVLIVFSFFCCFLFIFNT